jgi:hypothetical protein
MLIAVVLAVGVAAQMIGGPTASLTVGLASGCAMAFNAVVTARTALVLVGVVAGAAALGAAASGEPWSAGIAVAVAVAVTAPMSMLSAGLLLLAPLLTLVFAVVDRGWEPWQAGLWGVAGALLGLGIAQIMRFGKRAPTPLPRRVVMRHGAVLAVAAGVIVAATEAAGSDYGYWTAVTLLVALRPDPGARGHILRSRLMGTLAGVALALLVVGLVPSAWWVWIALACLVVLAAFAMTGNYLMQTLFLTPMLLLFLSASDTASAVEVSWSRAFFTVVGVAIAAALSLMLDAWERRDARAA